MSVRPCFCGERDEDQCPGFTNPGCDRNPVQNQGFTPTWQADYEQLREIPGLGLCGLSTTMMFTTGLMVGLDELGYAYRYCYEHQADAAAALAAWDGQGDPPGPWIKIKGHPDGERLGPGATSK
jgi:hypothetical protein